MTGDAPDSGEERLLLRSPADTTDEDLELAVVGAHALVTPRRLSGSGA